MAQYTELSVTAVSGKKHTFATKDAAGSVKGSGTFTELSVLGVSGRRYTFVAKTPAISVGKGTETFTQLSVTATSGNIHTFVAKSPAPVITTTTRRKTGGIRSAQVLEKLRLEKIHQDDEVVLEVIMNFILNCKD